MILIKFLKLKELKNVVYNDLGQLVYRKQLTYDEIIYILDLKHIPTKRTGYSLTTGNYEVTDLSKILKCNLPDSVKVCITIGDVRLKSNLKIVENLIFTVKFFLQF